jgi:ribosomal protection tetracycline resistance protein
MATLNLGILAHVDAGKTTLTERLLYLGGAIDRIGSVDQGTTQTDSLALERERGITIKTAVASFAVGDLLVNLIDTPGHPDFIAEVERVLGVLDGAILVVSAAEGVQPQTPLLMRALQRMRVPTLIFVNKIDRLGASLDRTLDAIRRRLSPDVVPMGTVDGLGDRAATFTPGRWDDPEFIGAVAETLAERDEDLLSAYVNAPALPAERVRAALVRHTRAGTIHPVFAGSAMTGTGGEAILAGAAELLAPPKDAGAADAAGSLAARTFKVERPPSGERVAYVRVFAGALRARDQVRYGDGREGRVTALRIVAPGGPVQRPVVGPGEIAKVSGLADIRVGDALGDGEAPGAPRQFAPPALESVVSPRRPADGGRLRGALNELAEQDPFINVRQDDERHEVSVSLYGEVQKQVIGETLARDYGVAVDFHETTSICIERPITHAEDVEVISSPSKANISGKSSPLSTNPWPATVGLRLEPAAPGSGIAFRVDVADVKLIPIRIYKDVPTFSAHMEGYVREALAEGLLGWQVTDCVVTLIDSGYVRTGTGAGDFRRVTEVVINRLLAAAGTQVCEPMADLRVELATAYASQVMRLLVQLGARVNAPQGYEGHTTIRGRIPVASVHELQAMMPGLTGGEGVIETELGGYEPVVGDPPKRRRR